MLVEELLNTTNGGCSENRPRSNVNGADGEICVGSCERANTGSVALVYYVMPQGDPLKKKRASPPLVR